MSNQYDVNPETKQYRRWERTCQECGHTGFYPWPANNGLGEQSEAFCERKCKKCKNPGSLDMGSAELFKHEWDKLEKEAEEQQE
jgi:hypothetical protein